MPMVPAIKTKWIAALRSGKHKQTTDGFLQTRDANRHSKYCCLGVLMAIQGKSPLKTLTSVTLDSVPHELNAGLTVPEQKELAQMNDGGDSFADIADYIENIID